MGWFGDSKWDPGNWNDLGDVPVVGDVWKGVTGDPGGIQKAYDKQIQASKDSQAQLQQFLMGQKGTTMGYFNQPQHLFQNYYGNAGIQSPQIPKASFAGTYNGGK